MDNYADFLLNLLAQFGGGRGETENELVRFGLAATFWGVLFAAAWSRWRQKALRHEKFLIWGFGLGFIREIFMFAVFSLDLLGVVRFDFMHVFFPPLEHVISMAAIIVVASAFLRYIHGDIFLSRRFLQIGLGVSAFCYLATFWWWAEAVTANPLLRFGQTWADWLFRICASLLIAFPIIILARERRWLSDIVVAALLMFFLDEVLMLFNLASGDVYREIYGPIRHNLHLLAIPLLGYVYIKEQSIERKQAMDKIKEESEVSSSLLQISETLNSGLDEKHLVRNIMEIAPKYLKFDKFGIFLYGENPGEFIPLGLYGFSGEEEKTLSAESFNKDFFTPALGAVLKGEPVTEADAGESSVITKAFNIRSAALAAVIAGGKLKGVLVGGYKNSLQIKSRDRAFLKGLSDSLGVAFQNINLYEDLHLLLINTITSFASALDTKSPWTRGHSERVTNYAVAIGVGIGFDEEAIEALRLGGLLHDIGKIGTYDVVLDKADLLSAEEIELIRKHPVQGALILEPIKQLKEVIPAVKHHHEKMDGTGYPDGLKGEEIPLSARILSVADTYDSMTADRPYRKAPGKERAVAELKRCSGTQFDSEVVEVFLEILKIKTED